MIKIDTSNLYIPVQNITSSQSSKSQLRKQAANLERQAAILRFLNKHINVEVLEFVDYGDGKAIARGMYALVVRKMLDRPASVYHFALLKKSSNTGIYSILDQEFASSDSHIRVGDSEELILNTWTEPGYPNKARCYIVAKDSYYGK